MSFLGKHGVRRQESMLESIEYVTVKDTDYIKPCLASK